MKKPSFLILPFALLIFLIPALLLIGCGGREETTTTTVPPTTAAPTTSTGAASRESTTATDQGIDEELVGIWIDQQGIQLEFTPEGVVFLRYQGQEAKSAYSTNDGKVSYISFEPNKQGDRLPTETVYKVDGDTLTWDSGENQLTFTRKQ